MNKLFRSMRSFIREEDGGQVIEYALIIAMVSVALILSIASLADTDFTILLTRISNCFVSTATCA